MALSLKPEHVKRYTDIARLLIVHGRGDLVQGIDAELGDEPLAAGTGDPEELGERPREARPDLHQARPAPLDPLRPAAGALPATRSPACRTTSSRSPSTEVEPIVSERARRADVEGLLGVRARRRSPPPRSARSIARRCATAGEVAVKVQRPGIRETIVEDLEALERDRRLVDRHTEFGARFTCQGMLDEFRKSLLRELDYRREAQNLVTLGHQPARLRAHRHPAADRRLHDQPRADDGLRRGAEDHRASRPLATLDLDRQGARRASSSGPISSRS